MTCQSHYACIIRTCRIDVAKEPSLIEALSPLADHVYRRCQHLQVTLKSQIAYEPIDVYNLHSPASKTCPLTSTVREQILRWLFINAGRRALVGGDLNTSLFSLETYLGKAWHLYFQPKHKHGDVSCGKGITAQSMPCTIDSTSKDHSMCIVHVTLKKLKPEKGQRLHLPK